MKWTDSPLLYSPRCQSIKNTENKKNIINTVSQKDNKDAGLKPRGKRSEYKL